MRLLPRLLHLSGSIAFLLSAAFGSGCYAQTPAQAAPAPDSIQLPARWDEPVGLLADKIAAAIKPIRTASLGVKNISSLDTDRAATVRQALVEHLAARRLRIEPSASATCDIQVTLSEAGGDYVWVAEIHQGNNELSVVMVTMPRPASVVVEHPAIAWTIRKTLLWTDENRILDVALLNGNPQHMIVLEPESIALLKFQDGRWQQEQSVALSHARPWPRDLRGRLALRNDHLFDAYLPGVFCRSSTTAPLALSCYESDDPWPLGTSESGLSAFFAPTRNFFTGVLSPGIGKQNTMKAFYSAAMLPRDKYKLWVFSTIDGQVHLLDGISDQTEPKLGWGSDIASVHSNCGMGWQVLVTSEQNEASDSIRASEIVDRAPTVVSQPAEFNGTITALWADADDTGAIAVSHNSETGRYEAYRLSIACSQ